MEWLFWILVFGCILAFIVYQCIMAQISWEKRKMLGFPDKTPLPDDCIEAWHQMLSAVYDRLQDTDWHWFDDTKKGMDSSYFTLRNSHDGPDIIRAIHMGGGRITIEWKHDKDIENPKNTPEVLKKYHTDLRKAADARYERKYRR